MSPRQRAEDTLVHYFRQLAKRAGMPWDSDNDTEIRGVVTDVLDAAREGLER